MDDDENALIGSGDGRYRERGIQDRPGSPSAKGTSSRDELRAAKEYAEMIVDSVREGLLILDLDLRVQAANQSFYDCFETGPEETVGCRFFELGEGQWDIPELRLLLEEILPEDKTVEGFEVSCDFPNIGRRVMLLSARRVDERDLILLAIEDITERRRAEETLRQGEKRYRTALRNSPVVFAHVDDELRYEWIFNPHPDFDPTAVVGKRDDELDAGPGIDALVALKQRVFETGQQERREITFARSDGPRTYDVTATPMQDEDGQVRKLITASLDITERVRLQEALRRLNATLEERVEERTRQVHALSASLVRAEEKERERIADILHEDVQQLLVGAHMFVQSAKELTRQLTGPSAEAEKTEGAETEELSVEAYKEKQEACLDQLQRILEEAIQDTKTLSVGLSPPIAAGEDLASALQWLAGHVEERYDLDVALHLAEGFAAASEEMSALLFRMTRELLFNVVKHAETERAAIDGKVERGQLVLSVRDEGKGFDKEVLKERPSGKGLREMGSRLEALGGAVEIDSAPGEGTRVTIRMPQGAMAGDL